MLGYYVEVEGAPVEVLVEIAKQYDLDQFYRDAQAKALPESCGCTPPVTLEQLVQRYKAIPSNISGNSENDLTIFVQENSLVQYASMNINLGCLNPEVEADAKTLAGALALAVTGGYCHVYEMKKGLRELMMHFVYDAAKAKGYTVKTVVV